MVMNPWGTYIFSSLHPEPGNEGKLLLLLFPLIKLSTFPTQKEYPMLWTGLEQMILLRANGVFDQKTEVGDQRFNDQK